jgi:hypothetical protein
MPGIDRHDGWILGIVVGALPAAIPLVVVMGQWVGCEPDATANLWLALGVGLFSWTIDVAVYALVFNLVVRVSRWMALAAALVAVCLVTVPLVQVASAVEQWRIGALADAVRATSQEDCGPGLLPAITTDPAASAAPPAGRPGTVLSVPPSVTRSPG